MNKYPQSMIDFVHSIVCDQYWGDSQWQEYPYLMDFFQDMEMPHMERTIYWMIQNRKRPLLSVHTTPHYKWFEEGFYFTDKHSDLPRAIFWNLPENAEKDSTIRTYNNTQHDSALAAIDSLCQALQKAGII